ncbi:MAG: NAD(P)/FAD-dependent oxidoreductase, partial [Planctomycetia bacterium]|nr:NAD(P)/FAD-dependent oxidoreductase [Planctomycetia bacterium]
MGRAGAYDLVVIGGGMGGLATAALAQRVGLRTALLEAHTKLGGCAGYFGRGPYTFDAGATALMGLGPGEPIAEWLRCVGVDFQSVKTPSYRVYLPDRVLDVVPDPGAFERASAAAFPGHDRAQRLFWRLQGAAGAALFGAAARIPRLPARSVGDLAHDLRALGVRGTLAATLWLATVRDVLRLLGLDGDLPFRTFIAMLLQDTAQAGPETVPFANAAACLHAYRLGMSRPRGGMGALVEGIGSRFAALGGDLRTATLVDRVEPAGDGEGPGDGFFAVVTRRRQRLIARQLAFNLPLDLAARLLGRGLEGRLGRREAGSRAVWSAFTGYVAFDRSAAADDAPLFHQVLREYDRPIHDGNNVLVSLSPPDDEGYGPPGVRVATLSTHTAPGDWSGLDRVAYASKKEEYRGRLLAALGRALPDAPARVVHAEFASPRSFARYTRRTAGAVGGPPVSRGN